MIMCRDKYRIPRPSLPSRAAFSKVVAEPVSADSSCQPSQMNGEAWAIFSSGTEAMFRRTVTEGCQWELLQYPAVSAMISP